MLMSYQPGTHLIATLQSSRQELLSRCDAFRLLADVLITRYGLQKLGDVYHNFDPSGFTAVVCLSESHLSIHTWPEHGLLNMDIYLSNYLRSNDDTVSGLYAAIKDHFAATVVSEQILKR